MMEGNVPVLFGRQISCAAMRLYNAVASTGREAIDIAALLGQFDGGSAAAKLVDRLEWLASGPKLNWIKVVAAARRAVRKFLDQFDDSISQQ